MSPRASIGVSLVTGARVELLDLTVYPDRGEPKAHTVGRGPRDQVELPKSVSGEIVSQVAIPEGALRHFSTLRRVVWPGRYA